MRIGYSFSISGDYPQDSLTIILEDGCEVAKGDLVYVEHPKKGSPVIYQITKVCSHKETRDYEEALLKGGSVIVDEERTTVRARAYQWGWMDGQNIRPLRYPLPPNTQVFNAPPDIIEEFTKPSSKWKIPLGFDPSSGLDVELDLYHLIRQCCLICGAVGTGKTTTAISMITRAAQAEPPVKFLIIDKDGEYGSLEMILGEKVKKIPWLSFFRSDGIHPEDLISEFRWQRGWWTSKILMKALSFLENMRQPLTKPHLTEAVKGVSEESVGFRRSEEDFDNYKRQVIEEVRFSRTIPNEHAK
ncbi:MAG: DUF87 domain-containing protein, partial [Candidatus Bathyarchaeota archaeon]